MPADWSDLPGIVPTKLSLRKEAFDSDDWLFELKHDGFRCLAYVADGECKLVSRNRNVFKTFKPLEAALAKTLKVKNAILDGELICMDSEGRSVFNTLIRRNGTPVFYAFDLLLLNNVDLRPLPLDERKRQLRKLIRRGAVHLLYATHVEGRGKDLYHAVCEQNLEGIVAKRTLGTYRKAGWLKIKKPHYTQGQGRKELFETYRTSRKVTG
jgi:bifunctional non-homologous end joining protein LigD